MKYNSTAFDWFDNEQGDMILGNAEWIMFAKASRDDPIVWRKTREIPNQTITCTFRKFASDKLNLTFKSEIETGAYERTFWFTNETHLENIRRFIAGERFLNENHILEMLS